MSQIACSVLSIPATPQTRVGQREGRRIGSRGMSLVEVCAAVAIFGIVTAGLTASTIGVIRTNSASRNTSVAAALIQQTVEQFRAVDPSTAPAELTAGTHDDPNNPIDGHGDPGGQFRRSWTVSRDIQPGLAQVVVEISWNDPIARSMSAVTYVCQTDSCS